MRIKHKFQYMSMYCSLQQKVSNSASPTAGLAIILYVYILSNVLCLAGSVCQIPSVSDIVGPWAGIILKLIGCVIVVFAAMYDCGRNGTR